MSGAFDDLAAITDAVYQADLARLKTIAAEEARLRNALAALAQEERHNAAADPGSALALRHIGGDVLWQAWVGRKREALNLQLATVMARKLVAAQALKQSFGRNTVSRTLRDEARTRQADKAALKALAEEQGHMVLQAGRKPNS